MIEQFNTKSDMWDQQWTGTQLDPKRIKIIIDQDYDSIFWVRLFNIFEKYFGKSVGLHSIEIGAGIGYWSMMLNIKRHFDVTMVDYSEQALALSKRASLQTGVAAQFIKADAINEDEMNKIPKHDIALSNGLAEHFDGENRKKILKAHFTLLKDRGMAIIGVPNSYGIMWRIYRMFNKLAFSSKYLRKKFKMAEGNIEIPFSRTEIRDILKEIGFKEIEIYGSSITNDIYHFIYRNIKRTIKMLINKKREELVGEPWGIVNIQTPLDDYFGAYLTIIAYK